MTSELISSYSINRSRESLKDKHELKKQLFAKLFDTAVYLYQSYEETKISSSEHCKQILSQKTYSRFGEESKKFVSEILEGIDTQKLFLNSMINAMLDAKVPSVSRSKITSYMVVIYLVVFRYGDINLSELAFLFYC